MDIPSNNKPMSEDNWTLVTKKRNGKSRQPRNKTNLTFRHGKPVGYDTPNVYGYWDMVPHTFQDKCSYDTLEHVFTWAESYRAGCIVVYKPLDDVPQLLIVHQQPPTYTSIKVPNIAFKGLPKGGRIKEDATALDTAFRELVEETSINLADPDLGAVMSYTMFAVERPEQGINEIIIYFCVTVRTKPNIILDNAELAGYEWHDVSLGYDKIQPVSRPTQLLFKMLQDRVDFTQDFDGIRLSK
jgi:8-oxo-dGTP pyrophosphatase MutT (NUDIX family)